MKTTLKILVLVNVLSCTKVKFQNAKPFTLLIAPTTATLVKSTTKTFIASGGKGTVTFSLLSGTGSINSTTGVYTAPAAAGTATVRATDELSNTADATITVTATATDGTALSISPATATLLLGVNQTFTAAGGTSPYTYAINTGSGTVGSSSGIYTRPWASGTASVKATDAVKATVNATITLPASYVQTGTIGDDQVLAVSSRDSSGNIYVVGKTADTLSGALGGYTNLGSDDAFLIKYDQYGNKSWVRQFGTSASDSATAVSLDSSGNIYVGGETAGNLAAGETAVGIDMFIAKFDSSGAQSWLTQMGNTTPTAGATKGNGTQRVTGVAVNSTGEVYVYGNTDNDFDNSAATGTSDIFVKKFDTAGAPIAGIFQNGHAAKVFLSGGIAIDSSDNVYIGGAATGFALTGGSGTHDATATKTDIFLAKLTSASPPVITWDKYVNSGAGTATGDELGGYVAIDSTSGLIYVSGYTDGSGTVGGQAAIGAEDNIVAAYDNAGTNSFISVFGTTANDRITGITASNGAYVAGYTAGDFGTTNAGSNDLFVAKVDSTGALWKTQIGSAADDRSMGICMDVNGGIFTSGFTAGALGTSYTNAGSNDLFLLKFSNAGVLQ